MSNKSLPFVCALIVCACASTPDGDRVAAKESNATAAAADGDGWITYCRQEKVLGSNLPEKICYRRKATESE